LQRSHFLASAFASADDAIAFCEMNMPDLMVIDFYQSSFTAEKLKQKLIGLEGGSKIPVIAISKTRQDDNRIREALPNVAHIFRKPLKVKDLVQRLTNTFASEDQQAVPIFNGDLQTIDIWKLLKNIEDTGISGYLEIIPQDGKIVKFSLIKGMLDDSVFLGSDENDPISFLLEESNGVLTVYQELVRLGSEEAIANAEAVETAEELLPTASQESSDGEILITHLSELIKALIGAAGRQETLKTFIKVSLLLSKDYPELRLLNVNYVGEVTWESEIEVEKIENYCTAFAGLFQGLLREIGAQTGNRYQYSDFFNERNVQLERIGFYGRLYG
jgi:DNA-binding response OmpR family regulator